MLRVQNIMLFGAVQGKESLEKKIPFDEMVNGISELGVNRCS